MKPREVASTRVPRRVTSVDSTAEEGGEKRSDPEGGHTGQDVAIKSIGIGDTEEESVQKLEIIPVVEQTLRKALANNDIELPNQVPYHLANVAEF